MDKKIDFSNIELPQTIYKYRDWEDEFHKRIITNREVYLSSPERFTDKKDCKIPIRYDLLTYGELEKKVKFDNPDWIRQRRRKFVRDWYKNRKDYVMEQQEYFQKQFFERFGVLSLTANPHNELMWLDYANIAQGFCIGFNTEILFQHLGGGGDVKYYDELPIIFPEPKQSFEEQHHLQIFSKLREFEYEQEYRTHIFSRNPLSENERKIIIPPEAYKEIIFGKNITSLVEEQILQNIPEELGHIILVN